MSERERERERERENWVPQICTYTGAERHRQTQTDTWLLLPRTEPPTLTASKLIALIALIGGADPFCVSYLPGVGSGSGIIP
jgi:hypothetical protein